VEVTAERLNKITELFDEGSLVPHVGAVLPLAGARTAHEMLGGAPHKRGKIVLQVAAKLIIGRDLKRGYKKWHIEWRMS
jgi:hypothetical protein